MKITPLPRCRPIKVIDVMFLIAVSAFGLASMRPGWVQFQTFWAGMKMDPPWRAYAGLAQHGITIAILNLGVAYCWVRLRSPRPPVWDLMRQPGMLASILLLVLATPLLPLSAFVSMTYPTPQIFAYVLGNLWIIACLYYRSRAEPGWIEAVGRTFAVGLIMAIASTS